MKEYTVDQVLTTMKECTVDQVLTMAETSLHTDPRTGYHHTLTVVVVVVAAAAERVVTVVEAKAEQPNNSLSRPTLTPLPHLLLLPSSSSYHLQYLHLLPQANQDHR